MSMFGMRHVDLGAEHVRAVRELARPHPPQQIEILLDRAIAIRAVRARHRDGAAALADLLLALRVDVRLARPRPAPRRSRTAARSSRWRSSSSSHSKPSHRTSFLIASTYLMSSVVGLVSSKRRLQRPRELARRCRSSGRSTWRGRCAESRSARAENGCGSAGRSGRSRRPRRPSRGESPCVAASRPEVSGWVVRSVWVTAGI